MSLSHFYHNPIIMVTIIMVTIFMEPIIMETKKLMESKSLRHRNHCGKKTCLTFATNCETVSKLRKYDATFQN